MPRLTPRALTSRAILTRLGVAVMALVLGAGLLSGDGGQAQSSNLGDENSWIRIQNVGNTPSAIEIDFFDNAGRQVASDGCPDGDRCGALQPGSGWSFFQQGFEALPVGYRGSGYVTADQPFVAMLARDAFKNGQFQIAGDTMRLGAPSARQYAPIVQNTATYVSRLSIENVSDRNDACVEIRYFAQGSGAAAAVDPPSGGAGCSRGGTLLRPRATLVRDETNLPVGFGFDGSAIVVTHPTDSGAAANAQQLSMVVDTRERTGPGLATYRAFDEDELSRVVLLPLADRNASERGSTWSTRFRILSGNPSIPNEVTLLFEGETAQGDLVEVEHTITVHGALTCDQRQNGAAGCLPADEPLPSTFRGTVRMQSLEPIAVVSQRLSDDGNLGDYRGFTSEEASRQVVLPVVNKNYGGSGGSSGWNSWFRVLTFDGSTAHVHVIYYARAFPEGIRGPGAEAVRGQRTFRQWENGRLPDGLVASAVIVADRPVVVIANLESDVFSGDTVMLYNGVSLE